MEFYSELTKLIGKTPLVKINNLKRLRISSLEITEITDEFLLILKNNQILVDHMHIPLQSGSNQILKKMNRKYDIKMFAKKIKKIRKIRPNMLITTDVIVAFPGETDEDFLNTVKTIKKINFYKVHIFPFSKKSGTKAALLNNQIADKIKKDRVNFLFKETTKLEQLHLKKYINKEVEVIFEQKKQNYLIGHAQSYIPVKVLYTKGLLNKPINVKIESVEFPYCIGKLRKEG